MHDDGSGFWYLIRVLTYTQHGGSGHHFTMKDLLELDISRIRWLAEELEQTRKAEAKAIEAASKKK